MPSGCCCRPRPRWVPTPTRSGRSRKAGRLSPTGYSELARGAAAGSDHQLAFVNALCTSVLSTRHVVGAGRSPRSRPRRVGPGRAVDRHRSALADRHRAGRRRRDRRRRPGNAVHRRRGPARPDRGGQALRRAGRGRATAGGGQGSGVDARSPKTTRWPTSPRRSIIAGFVRPGQAELLKPFGARYFAAIRGIWERRSSEVAQTVVVGLYPSWDISDDGIAAADAFLADPELPAGTAPTGARGPRRNRAVAAGASVRRRRRRPDRAVAR